MNQGDSRPKKRRRRDHKCTSRCSESVEKTIGTKTILPWTRSQYVPVVAEEMVLPLLIKYGSNEKGMMCKQPHHRVKKIRDACREHGIRLEQALSLRRTHIMNLNPYKRHLLNLGTPDDIRASAMIFEDIVKKYLVRHRLSFWTEDEQKKNVPEGTLCGPTPDFLFHRPVQLQISQDLTRPIFWIEAKMFYGASTIPHGSNNAVGKVLEIARKYRDAFGPGAVVFSFGCGERMKVDLETEGIFALDSRVLDLRRMYEHQRKWCADRNGVILP